MKTTSDGKKLTPKKIAGYQDTYRKWPSAGTRCLTDDGEAFIEGATLADLPCGCKVTGNGTLQFPLTVRPCAKHNDLLP